MNLSILLDEEYYAPGDMLSGTLAWFCDKVPDNLIVELHWRTSGRGTTDKGLVHKEKFPCSAKKGDQPFSFRIPPECPQTYRGRLVSITNFLKLRADIPWGRDPKTEVEVVISRTGEPICPMAEVE